MYGEGVVNINTANVPVLVSLGMDKGLAGKIVRFRAGSGLKRDGEASEGIFTEDSSIADFLNNTSTFTRDEIARFQQVAPLLGVKSDNFKGRVIGSFVDGREMATIVFVYDRKERLMKFWREA